MWAKASVAVRQHNTTHMPTDLRQSRLSSQSSTVLTSRTRQGHGWSDEWMPRPALLAVPSPHTTHTHVPDKHSIILSPSPITSHGHIHTHVHVPDGPELASRLLLYCSISSEENRCDKYWFSTHLLPFLSPKIKALKKLFKSWPDQRKPLTCLPHPFFSHYQTPEKLINCTWPVCVDMYQQFEFFYISCIFFLFYLLFFFFLSF